MHPDAMHDGCVAPLHELFWNLPGSLRHLPVRQTGLDDVDVVLNLVVRQLIDHFLMRCRTSRAAMERSREIGEIAEAADDIGIERHQFTGAHTSAARLVEPGIGTWTRCEQTGLDELTAPADDLPVHERKQFLFRDTRLH